jgi:hypothetical protein
MQQGRQDDGMPKAAHWEQFGGTLQNGDDDGLQRAHGVFLTEGPRFGKGAINRSSGRKHCCAVIHRNAREFVPVLAFQRPRSGLANRDIAGQYGHAWRTITTTTAIITPITGTIAPSPSARR